MCKKANHHQVFCFLANQSNQMAIKLNKSKLENFSVILSTQIDYHLTSKHNLFICLLLTISNQNNTYNEKVDVFLTVAVNGLLLQVL